MEAATAAEAKPDFWAVEVLDAGCLERVAAANQFAQLAHVRGGRHPGGRSLGAAEARDQGGIELVGFVAGALAAAIRLDAGRIDDADLHALAVQEGG